MNVELLWSKGTLRGHTCAGFEEFSAASTMGCIPHFWPEGLVSGCDDHNPVPILFCPFCGIELAPPIVREEEKDPWDE